MKEEINRILFSRHQASVADIRSLLEDGTISHDELKAVLGAQFVRNLPGEAPYLRKGGVYEGPALSNLVIFWGVKSSGRSSVIATLLALKKMKTIEPQKAGAQAKSIRSRIQKLVEVFKEHDSYQVLPDMSSDDYIETFHARYKKAWRSYNLTFIEAGPEDWNAAKEILKSNSRQIHIFCIDCRQKIDSQVKAHEKVIELLDAAGFLNLAVGVYILVTKADLMNAPALYLDNAAQTLVTASSASVFWQRVRNKCRAKYIYNEQPVVSSVGSFMLKDYAQLNPGYIQQLCDDCIIPKCEQNHWGLVKLLKMGSKKVAYFVIFLLVALLGVGAKYLFNEIIPDPTRIMAPYDYTTDFKQGVTRVLPASADYEQASLAYDSLRFDLEVEHSLKQQNKAPVMSVAQYDECDTKLSNAFSIIIIKASERHFESKNWSIDTVFMPRATVQLMKLQKHFNNMDESNVYQCREYLGYLICYQDTISNLLQKMKDCNTLDEVEEVIKVANTHVDMYPFKNDDELNGKLLGAPYTAYRSCTDHYNQKCNDLLNELDDQKSLVDKAKELVRSVKTMIIGSNNKSQQEQERENRIKALKDNVDKLKTSVCEYIVCHGDDWSDSVSRNYNEIVNDLSKIHDKLENVE